MKLRFFCMIFSVLLISASCGYYDHYTKNRINGTSLNSSMSDQEIVKAFGIDIANAASKKTNGKDGTMMTYTSGEQEVNVTRSTVSGVTVFATGPISGTWPLE